MLTRPNVYTVYDDTWSAYLCDYYNPYVSAGIVDTYEPTGTDFIRFVAPIQTSGDSTTQTFSDIHLAIDQAKAAANYQILNISATIDGTALDEYYLNVTNFIKKRDDPAVLMRTLGDDGSVQTIECDLGYYLNLVLMYRYTATEFKRFRIDLSRSTTTSTPTRRSPSLRSAT